MIHKTVKLFLLFLMQTCTLLNAQDTVLISQEELLKKLQDNRQLKIAEKEFKSAKADYQQSNALYLPQLNVSYTAMTTTNPLMAFGSKLNQEILTQQDFNPALLNDPDRTDNYATEISLQQPLINVDGLYKRKAARAKMEANQLKFQRTEDGMRLEITKAYMQLQLSYEAVKVLDKALVAANSGLKMVSDYYEEGLVKKPDLLAVEVRVNEVEQQKKSAENNLIYLSDYLTYLVNDSTSNHIYRPKDQLSTKLDLADIEDRSISQRKDVQAMLKAAEAYENLSKSSKAEFLPRLNAFGKYQMYDDAFLQADASGYFIGLQLKWDVFRGYRGIGQSQRDKINSEKMRLEADEYQAKSQLELRQQQRQLMLLKTKVDKSEKAVEQQREAYMILKDRFQQGLERTSDLVMAETQLLNKELEHLQSVFEYQLTQHYIKFLIQ